MYMYDNVTVNEVHIPDIDYFFVQDVCKSCGSFGLGEEGKLIVCTQCGQCYHPYCASVKVRTQLLKIT